MPDGSTKKTTITVTRRVVEAPAPPARPADPTPGDARVRYNVDRVNAYRAQKGLEPLLYDAKISVFATAGSERLSRDHQPHAHFMSSAKGAPGFGRAPQRTRATRAASRRWTRSPPRAARSRSNATPKLMMDEGPGGGHYDNMMSPRYRRIGIGLVDVGGELYMTNDFRTEGRGAHGMRAERNHGVAHVRSTAEIPHSAAARAMPGPRHPASPPRRGRAPRETRL